MATITTVHGQLIRYDANGNQTIINLKSAGADVSIDRTQNTKLPTSVTNTQTLANALKGVACKDSLSKSDVGLGSVDNTADANKSVKYATSAGSASKASTANALAVTAYITGGNANITGYRLLTTKTIGEWSNYRAIFLVNSRHEGAGILSVGFGCNAAPVTQASAYAEIKYFGLSSSGSVIDANSFQVYITSDGKTAYLFEKYWDYSTLSITCLSGDFTVNNGTWMESIPATYGTLKANTQINVASSVAWGNVTGKTNASASASGLMSSTDKAKLDFGDILYVSKSAPTKACIWAKLD